MIEETGGMCNTNRCTQSDRNLRTLAEQHQDRERIEKVARRSGAFWSLVMAAVCFIVLIGAQFSLRAVPPIILVISVVLLIALAIIATRKIVQADDVLWGKRNKT